MPPEQTARHFASLNLYARLGVGEEATDQEIRRAYRRLLKRVHPDLKGDQGEEARARFDEIMRAVNEARDTLLDPEKRARYDLRLRRRRSPGTAGNRDHPQRHRSRDDRHAPARSPQTEEPGWTGLPGLVRRALYNFKGWWRSLL